MFSLWYLEATTIFGYDFTKCVRFLIESMGLLLENLNNIFLYTFDYIFLLANHPKDDKEDWEVREDWYNFKRILLIKKCFFFLVQLIGAHSLQYEWCDESRMKRLMDLYVFSLNFPTQVNFNLIFWLVDLRLLCFT